MVRQLSGHFASADGAGAEGGDGAGAGLEDGDGSGAGVGSGVGVGAGAGASAIFLFPQNRSVDLHQLHDVQAHEPSAFCERARPVVFRLERHIVGRASVFNDPFHRALL